MGEVGLRMTESRVRRYTSCGNTVQVGITGDDGRCVMMPSDKIATSLPLEGALPLVAALVLRSDRYKMLRSVSHSCSLVADVLDQNSAIAKLLQVYPEAATVRCGGMLPLHAACYFGAPAVVLNELVLVYPDAKCCETEMQQTPCQIALLNGAPAHAIETLLCPDTQPTETAAAPQPVLQFGHLSISGHFAEGVRHQRARRRCTQRGAPSAGVSSGGWLGSDIGTLV